MIIALLVVLFFKKLVDNTLGDLGYLFGDNVQGIIINLRVKRIRDRLMYLASWRETTQLRNSLHYLTFFTQQFVNL